MNSRLATTYLGMDLPSPVVASAGPLTGRVDVAERLAAAGVGAIVLPSLFEEEIVSAAFHVDEMYNRGAGVFAEALSYLPELPGTEGTPDSYLDLVETTRARVDVPVIASLNGIHPGGWVDYATMLAEAGASAIELNAYRVAASPFDTAHVVEDELVTLVAAVREAVAVPIAVKLSPFFSALGDVAMRVVTAGADGLVLFNRFYQPDIDLESLRVVHGLELSGPADLRLALRWIGILHGRVPGALALSGGVDEAADVAKGLLIGADVVMTTSALLRHGPDHVRTLVHGLQAWLDEHEYESVDQLRGSMSHRSAPDHDAFERANYLQVLRRTSQRYAATSARR
jgi:dihydroorotate dehydrogenase (fumarate)